MGRDTVQLETDVTTISLEYLREFTSDYGISEALHPELPDPKDRIVDFPEGKDKMAKLQIPTPVTVIKKCRIHLVSQPLGNTYSRLASHPSEPCAPVHNSREHPLVHPEEAVVLVF
nr:hypothetical protein [Tanacetum cinerariifolium]